jgi:hypothetical protein
MIARASILLTRPASASPLCPAALLLSLRLLR